MHENCLWKDFLTENGSKHEIDDGEVDDGECRLSERRSRFQRYQSVPQTRVTTAEREINLPQQ